MGTQRVGTLETSGRGQIGRRIYVQEKLTQIGKKNNIYCMVVLQLVLLPDLDELILPGDPPY